MGSDRVHDLLEDVRILRVSLINSKELLQIAFGMLRRYFCDATETDRVFRQYLDSIDEALSATEPKQ